MPIYEYECGACGHQMEAFQKMSEAPLINCPECQKPALSKLMSSTSFQLKGTGWYATDFRDKGKPASTSSDKPAASTSTEPASTKAAATEAKPQVTEKKGNNTSTE